MWGGEKERKSQPYGLRFSTELHLHSNGGRTGTAWRDVPASVLSAIIQDGIVELQLRTASPQSRKRARVQAAELHSRAAQVSLLHLSLPGRPAVAFLDRMRNGTCVVFLLIPKASVLSECVGS